MKLPRLPLAAPVLAYVIAAPSPAAADELFFQGYLKSGEEEPVVFAVTGDFGDGLWNNAPALVASMVKGWRPDFFVGTGDLNYGRTHLRSANWDERIGTRYGDMILGRADGRYALQTSATQRFYPVLGNHDTSVGGLGGEGDIKGYIDYFVRDADGRPDRLPTGQGMHNDLVSYYDFRMGDMHFVMANSDRGRLETEVEFREAQNAWIGSVLDGSDARWKFVFMHHPPYSSDWAHGNQTWMQGEHLSGADVVFSAHAHVYERLLVDGQHYVTCGAGGRPFYGFRQEPLPESVVRYNKSGVGWGAMRVIRSGGGVLVEFRSLDDGNAGARGGALIDQFLLGEFEYVQNSQEHVVDLLAGQTVTVRTATPLGAGGMPNLLDPKVELVAPGGEVVGTVADGEVDGRNVNGEIVATVGESGRYRVRVVPEGEIGGFYYLGVARSPEPPAAGLPTWRARWWGAAAGGDDAGDYADPDRDGLINLLEYAMGRNPLVKEEDVVGAGVMVPLRPRGLFAAELELLEGIRPDLKYVLHANSGQLGETWVQVAEKTPALPWLGSVQVVDNPGEGEAMVWRVSDSYSPATAGTRLYRLGVMVEQAAP